MSIPRAVAVLVCALACVLPASAFGTPYSQGTPEQIAWVRRAASNFVGAELGGNGAGACAILIAPLRAIQHRHTCAQRLNAKLAKLLHEPGGRARLRAQRRAIPSAAVVVHGDIATIHLATPLMGRSNQLIWTENCWMVKG